MRILYITDIDLSLKDAQPVHVKEVVDNLSKIKNKMFFIGSKRGKIDLKSKTKYLFTSRVNILKEIIFNLKLLFILPLYIKRNRIDLIYTRQNMALIVPAIISKLLCVPYITELNGTIEKQMRLAKMSYLNIKLAVITEKYCYKTAKKIIVTSNELKDYIIHKYNLPIEKVIYLENGVNTKLFTPKNKLFCRKELNLDNNTLYGGYIGGLQNWQGLEYIIRSTKKVVMKIPNYKLIIVGEGPEKKDLINLTKKLNLEKNILFVGGVDHNKIPDYINSFDISLCYLTKINEGKYGTPFKVYEYLSCGSPTILSRIKGIEDLFKGNVITAKPEDSTDLANKIINLLKNRKLRETLSQKGRNFILNGHSWKNVAEKTNKVILKVIKN